MNTSCKECEFSTKDENNNQIGCEVKRLDLYKQQKTLIIEEKKENEPSYFLIQNRICSMCRSKESGWGDDLSLEEKKKKARQELELKMHAIIVCDHNTKIDDIIATGLSIEKQSPLITAHFVLTSNKPQSNVVIPSLRRAFPSSSNLFWNVKLCYERRNGHPLEKGEASDTVINNLSPKDCQFYVLIDPGAILWDSFSADIDKAINDKLERFVFLTPIKQKDNNKEIGPVVHTQTHLIVGGNALAERDIITDGKAITIKCNSVFDKINQLASDQRLTHLIKDLYYLCPQ